MDGGRGLYIPFVPPESRRRNGCCRSIPPPAFLALQSGCPAVHPLSRASRDKRYNTLDFFHCVPKVVCQRGTAPFGNPHHFRELCGHRLQKRSPAPRPENGNSSTVLHPQARRAVIRPGRTLRCPPVGNPAPNIICSASLFPCYHWPADAGRSCCRCRTSPVWGL